MLIYMQLKLKHSTLEYDNDTYRVTREISVFTYLSVQIQSQEIIFEGAKMYLREDI